MGNRQTIEGFIRDCFADTDKGERPVAGFSLVHLVGRQEKVIHAVKLGAGSRDPKDLADLFDRKAKNQAQNLPGVQSFNVLAFWGEGKTPEAEWPFMVNGDPDAFSGGATEPPDKDGVIRMIQRQGEMLFQQTYRRQQLQDERSDRLIEMLLRDNLDLRRENMDAVNVVKEYILDKAKNSHEFRMKELEFERSTEERRKWLGFMPSLVNTVLGKEVFPHNAADTALIETIAENLTEDDVMKLGAIVGGKHPAALGPIMHRFKELSDAKKARGEKATELALLSQSSTEHD